MSFLNEYFLTVRNLQNLLSQTTMIATLALGQLLVIIVRGSTCPWAASSA